jgi:L-asparaginase
MAQIKGDQVVWEPDAENFIEQNMPLARTDVEKLAIDFIANEAKQAVAWPRVEIVLNHAQASGAVVRALLAASTPQDPLQGIVVAATGNGTVSALLQSALDEAQSRGVEVLISSRCAWGGVHDVSALSAVKARIELVLELTLKRLANQPTSL